jgi:four helix bundle protein
VGREREYQRLIAWQKGMDFAEAVYDATDAWPRHEQFDLRSQARRAAFSVPANIAEGHGRFGERDFLRFLTIAYGSLNEAETAIQFAFRRRYLDEPTLDHVMDKSGEVGRVLLGLMQKLRRSVSD